MCERAHALLLQDPMSARFISGSSRTVRMKAGTASNCRAVEARDAPRRVAATWDTGFVRRASARTAIPRMPDSTERVVFAVPPSPSPLADHPQFASLIPRHPSPRFPSAAFPTPLQSPFRLPCPGPPLALPNHPHTTALALQVMCGWFASRASGGGGTGQGKTSETPRTTPRGRRCTLRGVERRSSGPPPLITSGPTPSAHSVGTKAPVPEAEFVTSR